MDVDAAGECRRILKLDENYYPAYFHLSFVQALQGRIEEALSSAEKGYSLAPWVLYFVGWLAGLLRRTGDASRSAMLLQKLGDGTAYSAAFGFFFFPSGLSLVWNLRTCSAVVPCDPHG